MVTRDELRAAIDALALIPSVQIVRFEVNENGFPEVVPMDSEKPIGTTTVYEVTIQDDA